MRTNGPVAEALRTAVVKGDILVYTVQNGVLIVVVCVVTKYKKCVDVCNPFCLRFRVVLRYPRHTLVL